MLRPDSILTALSVPMSKRPASLAVVKRELGIVGTADDPELLELIAAVGDTAAGPEAMNRPYWRCRWRVRMSGSGRPRLLPRIWPIERVELIRWRYEEVDSSTYEITGTNHDELYMEDGWRSSCPGDFAYEVIYWGGWIMPDEIATWSPETQVEPGKWVRGTQPTLLRFEATSISYIGETGVSEPSWPENEGENVVDGDVVWTARAASEQPAEVTRAANFTAVERYRGALEIPLGVESETDNSGTTRYVSDSTRIGTIPPAAAATWRRYR